MEQSRFSRETVPKTGHGTKKEPRKEPSISTRSARARKKPSFDPMSVVLPDWLPEDTWAMWVKYRTDAKKAMTEDTVRLQLLSLGKFRNEGHDVRLIIEAAVENSWQGLFVPKDGRTLARNAKPVAADDAGAPWWARAGFANAAHAGNYGCYAHTAHHFRDGQRIEEAHA